MSEKWQGHQHTPPTGLPDVMQPRIQTTTVTHTKRIAILRSHLSRAVARLASDELVTSSPCRTRLTDGEVEATTDVCVAAVLDAADSAARASSDYTSRWETAEALFWAVSGAGVHISASHVLDVLMVAVYEAAESVMAGREAL